MVYELTHSGGSWTLIDLHDFAGGAGGSGPEGGVTLDSSGNLYGTTYDGGVANNGTVWEITRDPGHDALVKEP